MSIINTALIGKLKKLKANLNSPAFTGIPTAPTAANGTNTTQIATTAFVIDAVSIAGGYSGWDLSDGTNTNTINSTDTVTISETTTITPTFNGSTNTLTFNLRVYESTLTTTDSTEIFSIDSTETPTVKLLVSVLDNVTSQINSTEILMMSDGTDAYVTQYGTLIPTSELATFTAVEDSGSLKLFTTPVSSNSTKFRVQILGSI